MVVQWRTQRANPEVKQSWDETARFNNLLARLSILLVRQPPHLPHLYTPTALSLSTRLRGGGGGESGSKTSHNLNWHMRDLMLLLLLLALEC